jgi:hypothetical protein
MNEQAIASMGGSLIDCNQLFSLLSNYTKQELCSLTVFQLTSRQDLQKAFDQISRLISSSVDEKSDDPPAPVVLQGSIKDRDDLGLSVALIRGKDDIAKCFCVTLIKNPTSMFDLVEPVSFDFVRQQQTSTSSTQQSKQRSKLDAAPAFTSG